MSKFLNYCKIRFFTIFIALILGIISLFLIVILITFNPSDPSWFQEKHNGSIYNAGGEFGARFSDFLFFIFGISAYVIPITILYCLWEKFYLKKKFILPVNLSLKLIGVSILIFSICIFAELNIKNYFYFSSGGILGYIFCNEISPYLFKISMIAEYKNVIFLLILSIGFMFFFNQLFFVIYNLLKKFMISYFKKLNINSIKTNRKDNNFKCSTLFFELGQYPKVFSNEKDCVTKFSNFSFKRNESFGKKLEYKKENKRDLYFNLENDTTLNIRCCASNIYVTSKLFNENKKICICKKKIFKKNYNDDCQKDNSNQKKSFKLISNKEEKIEYGNLNNTLNLKLKCHNKLKKSERSSIGSAESVFPFFQKKTMILPDTNLLNNISSKKFSNLSEFKKLSQLLELKLIEYNIMARVVNIIPGPVITRFELDLSPGIKSSKIVSLSRDLSRALLVDSLKVVEVIPGKSFIGLDISNKNRSLICLKDIIESEEFQKINTPLALVLGKNIFGYPVITDLRNMPHLLVSGATGSGKSMGINVMIISMLYKSTPEEVRFIMIDPKILELSAYSNIPHLLKTIVTDIQEVEEILRWCIKEMENRYQVMSKIGVRNLESYNCYVQKKNSRKILKKCFSQRNNKSCINNFDNKFKKLPYIVIIIDEFADLILTQGKNIEILIIRLTQKARAAGIHMILATQRPSVNVMTGLIKSNIPARLAFKVSSKVDSYTILGQSGAESLLEKGDMLYLSSNSSVPLRVHGAFISDKEIFSIVNFLKS